MAKYSRLNVLNSMIETGLVPVFYYGDVEVAIKIVDNLLDAGVRCIEFTNRGDQAHLVFAELIRHYADNNQAILGVGSVMDVVSAGQYIQLGANFVVGPILNAEIAKVCNRRKVAYSPGCGNVSEISTAEELGVEIVKIFPGAQIGGPDFVKSILGPMPWTYIMPTGGVSPEPKNIRAWFESGVACVGMGSKLVRKNWVKNENFDSIRETASKVLRLIQEIRIDHPIFY